MKDLEVANTKLETTETNLNEVKAAKGELEREKVIIECVFAMFHPFLFLKDLKLRLCYFRTNLKHCLMLSDKSWERRSWRKSKPTPQLPT